jgi:hypothetical protein
MVGGGDLNFLAGCALYGSLRPNLVVCAYGDRAKYLKVANAPSESEVMSDLFKTQFNEANFEVWPSTRSVPGPSNTNSELQNIFELAMHKNERHVGIVTIDLHMPRTMVLAQRHLTKPEFRNLRVDYFVSEQVLVEKDPKQFGPRRENLRNSQSFKRNWEREQLGIFRVLTNAYGDEKPLVAAAH